jgi:hypothetical protein
MSMLFGWSAEENEWADNYERFIQRIQKDALIKYNDGEQERKVYVICPEYITLVRSEYEFWSWEMEDCVRKIKKKAKEKGVPYEIIHIDYKKLDDDVNKRRLKKLYLKMKG